jgi:rhodanese-related sulfurtransferase
LLGTIGGLIAIASAPARFISSFFVGLGLLLFAIGQWKDRPIQTSKSGGASAFGERSAMAVQAAQDAGLKTACHIQGGIDAWKKANGPLNH